MSPPHNSEREAKILRDVSAPNIIQLVDVFWEAGGHFVLVFPFMSYNLDELLHQNAMNGWQMRSHLRDLFRGLAHIHSFGIIHRDIKPSNVLLHSMAGPAYLADFGVAWCPEHNLSEKPTQKITSVGTTCYRPPEVLFGDTTYGTSLDLWAAGCVVAEVVDVHHKPLFDSGPVGSELSLIQSIFSTLGTPNSDIWPVRWVTTIYHSRDIKSLLTCEKATQNLPDWGKMEFREYPPKSWDEILCGAASNGRDLASRLVRYESSERISTTEVCRSRTSRIPELIITDIVDFHFEGPHTSILLLKYPDAYPMDARVCIVILKP
jgi:cyclin-dependent kinase